MGSACARAVLRSAVAANAAANASAPASSRNMEVSWSTGRLKAAPTARSLLAALIVKLAAGALEALVERARDVGGHRAEPRPLRLGAAHFLLRLAPAGLFGMRHGLTSGHRVGRQPLAPALGEQLRGR